MNNQEKLSTRLNRAGYEQYKTCKQYCKINGFAADIPLVQGSHAVYERYYNAASTYHGYNRYHGLRLRQSVEICYVGYGEKY